MLPICTALVALVASQKCIGHRGYPLDYPENTMISLSSALEIGTDGIETDVRLTKDNKTLDRTTNGRGYTTEHTWEEIKSLSSYGQKVPLMSEALDLILQHPGKFLVLDIKNDSPIEILKQMQGVFKEYSEQQQVWLKAQVFLVAWSVPWRDEIRRLFPGYKIAYSLFSNTVVDKVDLLSVSYQSLTQEFTRTAKKSGKSVAAWTVDSDDWIRYVFQSLEADFVISNDSPTCVQVRNKLNETDF